MNNEIAIRVVNLSKKYTISGSHERISLTEGFKSIFKRKPAQIEEFYALKDINFEIKKGEAVGIIGRNGAGKSTLLKILSRVTEPSEGRVEIYGSVASVLEVGMGFHPEFSGRENVYLSATLLGIPKKQIEARFDEIVAFAGVQKFIDTPVKHYSSGMYVRLAFSVVANIDADILLFDEVLSVGDMAFQMKCSKKIRELVDNKKTVLIVSHNLNDIMNLCGEVILLNNGKLERQGKFEVLKDYFEESSTDVIAINNNTLGIASKLEQNENILFKEWNEQDALGNSDIKIIKIWIQNESRKGATVINTDDKISLNIEYKKLENELYYNICFFLSTFNNIFLFALISESDTDYKLATSTGSYCAKAIINESFLNSTLFTMGCAIADNNNNIILMNPNMLKFKTMPSKQELDSLDYFDKFNGPMKPKLQWKINKIAK